MAKGAVPVRWWEYRRDWEQKEDQVIEETPVTIYVNGEELATIMSTPREQDLLALGFLKNERLISSMDDVESVRITNSGCCVDVWLGIPFIMPEKRVITTGCGGGVTFDDAIDEIEPVDAPYSVEPGKLHEIFNQLQVPDSLYAVSRGVHTAGLVDGDRVIAAVEDVGRHSTIDKLTGACLVNGIETKGMMLLATGRVSSEMLRKGAVMGCPVVASRNSPTSLSIEMAEALNITLVGYVRRGALRVYSHPERLGYQEAAQA